MDILIPLTQRLRAFGKSWIDSYRCHIFNVLKDVLKELINRQGLIVSNVLKGIYSAIYCTLINKHMVFNHGVIS